MGGEARLYGEGLVAEPRGIVGAQSRRERVIDKFVVGVEPIAFIGMEHLTDEGRGIEVANGDRVEGEPFSSEISVSSIDAENEVFVTYAVLAFAVDAGFIGGDHSG